jgi:hypothetical protein
VKLLLALALLALPVMAQRTGPYDCTRTAISGTITGSGATQIIPVQTGLIRICQIIVQVVQTATPANFGVVSGSGTNCATNQGAVSAMWTGVASAIQGYTKNVPYGSVLFVANNNGVCLNLSAAVTGAQIEILYDVY